MISTRCAACKYLRRRCPQDCIFAPYFPSTNSQRFACVHKIFGASNVAKMLKQVPVHKRDDTVDSLIMEAQSRIQDPVYGCVGIISHLQQQIRDAESQVAKVRAEIAFNVQQQSHHLLTNPLQFQQFEGSSFLNNVSQLLSKKNNVSQEEMPIFVEDQTFAYPFIQLPKPL